MTDIRRKRAADILDQVRVMLAARVSPEAIEAYLFKHCAIEPLVKCDGNAHDPLHIDHCPSCAPRWGWRGTKVRIT